MRTMQKNYLITGCGGYIGSHLLDRLLKREEISIFGWDIDSKKIQPFLSHPRLSFHQEDVSEAIKKETFLQALKKADVVIQLAGVCNPSQYNTVPLDVINSNFIKLYPLIDLCSKHKKWIIHFSTSEVYGRTLSSYCGDTNYENIDLYELREQGTPLIMGPIKNQRWSYACAKQLMERYIYGHYKTHNMPFTIVRPLNFFGFRMDYLPGFDGQGIPRVLACYLSALFNGTPLKVVDGGTARRTITAIEDAIDSIELMLDKPKAAQNEIFNIGNRDNEVTMLELAELMRRLYARLMNDKAYEKHPIKLVSAEEFYGEGYEDCDRRFPDISLAQNKLGWEPKIPLEEILWNTMIAYRKYYLNANNNSVQKVQSQHTDYCKSM